MSSPSQPSNARITRCDVAIAGGGLAGGLIALVLAKTRPDLDVRIVEPAEQIGGNHIWSFFDCDVSDANRWLVEPLITHRWEGYDVRFPGHRRSLGTWYNAIESDQFDAQVRSTINAARIIRQDVVDIAIGDAPVPGAGRIVCADQSQIESRYVIDARGPGDLSTLGLGWQKFVGQALTVQGGHGLTRPIVMDATVAQLGAYRFVYCLPFDAETVFVEDTYYSDGPDLNVAEVRQRIADYAAASGWQVTGVGREEAGVLPVVIAGDFAAYWDSTGADVPKAGLRSGMFHATTGYSLPDAVRLACALPDMIDRVPDLAQAIRDLAAAHWRSRGYYRMLDKMLFHAAEPDQRYRMFERFYRLSPGLIERFYAGQSSAWDKLRILSGKPPVSVGRAFSALLRSA